MADAIPLSEIPTLSLLYKINKIAPSPDLDPSTLPTPSAAYNDKISVIRQDITVLAVDSIVNAANNSLLGGGGVDGAIHCAAGPELLDECELLEGCDTGDAKITNGYDLPAKKVIHAVGPIYWDKRAAGKHTTLLSGCYRRSLELAVENGLKSIAFSALSTGVYGYPSGEASETALATVRQFMDEGKADDMDRIIFCNFMQKDEDAYFENIPRFFPPVVAEPENADEPGKEKSTDETELAAKLPDVPTEEPKDPAEPLSKKQKTEAAEEEFVAVDREKTEEAEEAKQKEAEAPKADL
ncbi:MACRO domain-containing protein 1 [Lindgomyces ingoldianus]|uniref:MACRO domain-containing protein 1 n=1 Tax=Lindgomyces ingoldianus TaxID=673940 RepID=A0ACB6R0U2_9PLEO|nr:MACRO domain-containing protein 1 [Lindgomyces ingoldianus]KAF2472766.1 MACRO domain-containing protein 1 [Lindgomyces ingoldianus]